MDAPTREPRDYSFAIGLLTGTAVGASLAMWLAPRSAVDLCQRVTDSAQSLGGRVSDTVDELAWKGHDIKVITYKQGSQNSIRVRPSKGGHAVERVAGDQRLNLLNGRSREGSGRHA